MKKIILILMTMLIYLIIPITSYAAKNDYKVLNQALFVGDSFTAKLENRGLEEEYNLSIIAYPGVTSKKLKDNFEEYAQEMQPSRIIVLCGINDLILSDYDIVNVDEEAALLKEIQEKYNVPVYVQLLFPVSELFIYAKPTINNEKIEKYNDLLTELCYQNGYFIIDTRNEFIGEDGYLQHTEDGLHINDEYEDQYIKNIVYAVTDQEREIKRIIAE